MSGPEHGTIFESASAASAAVKAMPRAASKPSSPHALTSAALAVAAQRFERAYSPIVLAGVVRAIEVALVAGIGLALYLCYVEPISDSARYYLGSIAGISLLSLLAFQTA